MMFDHSSSPNPYHRYRTISQIKSQTGPQIGYLNRPSSMPLSLRELIKRAEKDNDVVAANARAVESALKVADHRELARNHSVAVDDFGDRALAELTDFSRQLKSASPTAHGSWLHAFARHNPKGAQKISLALDSKQAGQQQTKHGLPGKTGIAQKLPLPSLVEGKPPAAKSPDEDVDQSWDDRHNPKHLPDTREELLHMRKNTELAINRASERLTKAIHAYNQAIEKRKEAQESHALGAVVDNAKSALETLWWRRQVRGKKKYSPTPSSPSLLSASHQTTLKQAYAEEQRALKEQNLALQNLRFVKEESRAITKKLNAIAKREKTGDNTN